MKPSTELFDLIKSMTKSEKRFFKLSSSLQSGKKNYVELFDYIERQKAYNEEALKEHFKKEKFIKHLPSEKNHLYKQLLKALSSFHQDNSVSGKLKQEIRNIEILFERALYKEATKFAKRASKLAEEHEKFYYWSEVMAWIRRLYEDLYDPSVIGLNIAEIQKQEEEIFKGLVDLSIYQDLFFQVIEAVNQAGYSKGQEALEKVTEIVKSPYLQDGVNISSVRSKGAYHTTRGMCFLLMRNFKKAQVEFDAAISVLDEHPKIKGDIARRYIDIFKYSVICSVELDTQEVVLDKFEKLKEMTELPGFNRIDVKLNIYAIGANLELYLLNLGGMFLRSNQVTNELSKQDGSYWDRLKPDQQLTLLFNRAYAKFGVGEYRESLKLLNHIQNDYPKNEREDIHRFGQLLFVLVQYELGNIESLPYFSSSIVRQLSKKEATHTMDILFIKGIGAIAKAKETDRIAKFQRLLEACEDLYRSNPQESIVLEYVNILAWLISKVRFSTFAEEAKKLAYISRKSQA